MSIWLFRSVQVPNFYALRRFRRNSNRSTGAATEAAPTNFGVVGKIGARSFQAAPCALARATPCAPLPPKKARQGRAFLLLAVVCQMGSIKPEVGPSHFLSPNFGRPGGVHYIPDGPKDFVPFSSWGPIFAGIVGAPQKGRSHFYFQVKVI